MSVSRVPTVTEISFSPILPSILAVGDIKQKKRHRCGGSGRWGRGRRGWEGQGNVTQVTVRCGRTTTLWTGGMQKRIMMEDVHICESRLSPITSPDKDGKLCSNISYSILVFCFVFCLFVFVCLCFVVVVVGFFVFVFFVVFFWGGRGVAVVFVWV